MKFAIVLAVLAVLVALAGAVPLDCGCPEYFCEYKECKANPEDLANVSPQMQAFDKVLGQKVGPKVVKIVNMLSKIKAIGPIIDLVASLGTNLLKSNGQLEQLLAGGDLKKALNGPNLKRDKQEQIYKILSETTAKCVACEITLVVTLLVNGLLGKVLKVLPVGPLVAKVLPLVGKVTKVIKPVQKALHKLLTGLLGPSEDGKGALDGVVNTVNHIL